MGSLDSRLIPFVIPAGSTPGKPPAEYPVFMAVRLPDDIRVEAPQEARQYSG
jgi:hypothetical protein